MSKIEPSENLTPPTWRDELLSPKELGGRIGRTARYVYAMKRDGFEMPGQRATVDDALEWIHRNPDFRQNRPKKKKPGR